MKRSLVFLVFCLLISVVQSASASPQTDADYIAAHFITSDDFQTMSRNMVVEALAGGVSAALATRSVKIRDNDKFVALLPETVSSSLFERLQKTASDQLVQGWEPAQLASLADYLQELPPGSQAVQSGANADTENSVLTVEQFQQKIAAFELDETAKNEIAATAVVIMLISLVVQENSKIEIDLKAPYVADMLEEDGVFSFPNRIARNDLIRELRGSGS